MNTLYTFGDSYLTAAETDLVYPFWLSKKYDMLYEPKAVAGYSNFQIFNSLLENLISINENDFLVFSWSFINRGCYVNESQELQSMNELYEDLKKIKIKKPEIKISIDDKTHMLKTYLDYSYDINYKLFKFNVVPLQKYLKSKNIKFINLFANRDFLQFGNTKYFDFPKVENTINFEGSDLVPFLQKKNWHTGESGHFKYGIQHKLLDIVHSQIKKYYKNLDI